MSSKGNIRFSKELLENLKKVIGASSYNYIEPDKNVNYSLPIVIPSEKLNEQKQKNCDKGKRNAVQQDHVAKKEKKVDDKINVPVISCAEDLSGKLVEHLCVLDSEEEEKRWVKGVVLEEYGKTNYLIKYHEREDRLFSRNLFADCKNNKLKNLFVSYKDFISASIKHMYEDSKSKENIWWDAEVVDVDMDSADMDNPDFFIIYKDRSDAS